jgi:hypothetical protein
MVKNMKDAGVKYLIAPSKCTYWSDAAFFLISFYRFLFVEKHSLWVSFKKTNKMRKQFFPKLTGDWNFYEQGKLCFSSPYSYKEIGTKLKIDV